MEWWIEWGRVLLKQQQDNIYSPFRYISVLSQCRTTSMNSQVRTRPMNQPPVYTNLIHENERYRILSYEYNKTMSALTALHIFWLIALLLEIAVLALSLAVDSLQGQEWAIFAAWFTGVMVATLFALRSRRQLKNIILFSMTNLTLYLLTCTILLVTHTRLLIIPSSVYMCTEILLSLLSLQNRRKLFSKLLLFLQLLLIILKLDNIISCDWLQVYFGFVLTTFIGYVVMLSMILFFVVNVGCLRDRLYSIKHIGIGFIFLNSAAAVFGTMIPIANDFYHFNMIAVGASAILVTLCYLAYGWMFRNQIIMFLCRVEKVKSFNQIITLANLPPASVQPYVFCRKSENWYEKSTLSDAKNQLAIQNVTENPEKSHPPPKSPSADHVASETPQPNSENKCLICFELDPCVIWMPCGHLTVCQICCDRILDSKNCNCLLCKDVPEAIYFVYNQQTEKPEEMSDQIKTKNEIEDEVEVEADSKENIKQFSTKDLDMVEASISGEIIANSQKKMFEDHDDGVFKKDEVLFIRNGFSIKIC